MKKKKKCYSIQQQMIFVTLALGTVFTQMIFLSFTSKADSQKKLKLRSNANFTNIKISETKWEHLQKQRPFVYRMYGLYTYSNSVCGSDRIDRLFDAVTFSIWSYQCDTKSKQIFQICVNYFLASYLSWNSLRLWLKIDAFLFLFFFFSFPTVA